LTHPARSFLVIAADNNVTIYRAFLCQHSSREIVKRGHNRYSIRDQFIGLLRYGALPDAKSAGGAPAYAGRQRHGRVHEDLPGPQGRFQMLEHFRVDLKGNRKDDNVG
jgi:hypothetical protein